MRKNQGFTLIELMIVVAIIAIIAAIAVPNLLQSRMRANETSAIASISSYASAQQTYNTPSSIYQKLPGGTNTGAGNAYVDNYSNLFFGQKADAPAGTGITAAINEPLGLINAQFANSFAKKSAGLATKTTGSYAPLGTAVPYNGYQYAEPNDIPAGLFVGSFALIGLPANAGQSGTVYVYIDGDAQPKTRGADMSTANKKAEDAVLLVNTPQSTGTGSDLWN